MNSSTDSNIFKNLLLNGTILIAIVSFLSYIFGYTFKLGYCYYFGIPTEFISLTFKDVIGTASIVFILAILFFLYSKFVNYIFKKFKKKSETKNNYIIFEISRLFLIIPIFLIYSILFNPCILPDINILVLIGILIFFVIVTIILSYKLDKNNFKDGNRQWFVLILNIISLIAICVLIFLFSYNYAPNQTSFSYININQNNDSGYIILVNNEKGYVCTKLDNDTSKSFSKFYLIDYSTISDNNYSIKEKDIGTINFRGEKRLFHKGIIK